MKFLKALGRTDIPVFEGQHKPLVIARENAGTIHGKTGLDGTDLPPELEGETAQQEKGVLAMAQYIANLDDTITVVATGSLTNVAMALALYPEIAKKIDKLSIMGGGLASGNWT